MEKLKDLSLMEEQFLKDQEEARNKRGELIARAKEEAVQHNQKQTALLDKERERYRQEALERARTVNDECTGEAKTVKDEILRQYEAKKEEAKAVLIERILHYGNR